MTTASRVFSKSLPRRRHLLVGRGLNGEILDVRQDVDLAFSRLESEVLLDVQFAFDGIAPPTPGTRLNQYGICHTSGGAWLAGTVVFDDGKALQPVTKKGLAVTPRTAVAGTIVMDANAIYVAMSDTPPYTWTAKGGGGGGSGDATSIQTVPVDSTPPALNQVLVFDGDSYAPMQITQDMILPAFEISAFTPAVTQVEAGATLAVPAFTASYTLPPDTAPNSVVLTDDVGTPAKDVTGTPTAFASDGSFTYSTYGAVVNFTLTAKKGVKTDAELRSATWLLRAYWGVAAVPGAYDEAFIKSLSNYALASSRNRTFSVNAGPGQKIFYCYRVPYGDATFTVGGFTGGFFKAAASVSVTNSYGVVENYMVWESDNPGLGPTTVTVT